jgi:hypothetical protein
MGGPAAAGEVGRKWNTGETAPKPRPEVLLELEDLDLPFCLARPRLDGRRRRWRTALARGALVRRAIRGTPVGGYDRRLRPPVTPSPPRSSGLRQPARHRRHQDCRTVRPLMVRNPKNSSAPADSSAGGAGTLVVLEAPHPRGARPADLAHLSLCALDGVPRVDNGHLPPPETVQLDHAHRAIEGELLDDTDGISLGAHLSSIASRSDTPGLRRRVWASAGGTSSNARRGMTAEATPPPACHNRVPSFISEWSGGTPGAKLA